MTRAAGRPSRGRQDARGEAAGPFGKKPLRTGPCGPVIPRSPGSAVRAVRGRGSENSPHLLIPDE